MLAERLVIKEKAAFAALQGPDSTVSLSRRFYSTIRVLLFEFLNSSCGVNYLLFAGIERVAERTNFNRNIFSNCWLGDECAATATCHVNRRVWRVDVSFHFLVLSFPRASCTLFNNGLDSFLELVGDYPRKTIFWQVSNWPWDLTLFHTIEKFVVIFRCF